LGATAFATFRGEGCTKFFNEKVLALFKAVGLHETAAATKDQLLKNTIAWT
jgi:hypothetical protein